MLGFFCHFKSWILVWNYLGVVDIIQKWKYFSERFFSRADLVQEEMEDTTAKLEKVDLMRNKVGKGQFDEK